MLIFSTKANNIKLLNIVIKQLNNSPPRIQEAKTLIKIISFDKIPWDTRLLITNMLLNKKRVNFVKSLIDDIDITEYYQNACNLKQVNLLFSVLIRTNHSNEVLLIIESENNAKRFSEFEDMDIRLRLMEEFFHKGEIDNLNKVIFEIDHKKMYMALSSIQKLSFSKVLTNYGKINFALNVIKIAYEENSNIKDGYVKIAWNYFHKMGNYKAALKYMLKDYALKRISPCCFIKLAIEYAYNNELSEAKSIIKQAYNCDLNLKDGYAEVAEELYLPQMKYNEALKWFMYDESAGRLSQKRKLVYAQLLVAFNHHEKVNILSQNCNRNDIYYNKGLGARLGKRFNESLNYFERLDTNTYSLKKFKEEYVLALLLCDQYDLAESVIRKNQLLSSGIAIKQLKLHIMSMANEPDYTELVKLCKIDFDLKISSFLTWMRLLTFQLLAKDATGARDTLKKSIMDLPEFRTKFEFDYALWSYIANITDKVDCSGFFKDIQLDSNNCLSLFEIAVTTTLSGHLEQTNMIVNRIYSLNPTFFQIKSAPVFDSFAYLAIILHHYGMNHLSNQCVEFAEQNSPIYPFLSKFIDRERRSKIPCHKYKFPEFVLPWECLDNDI